MKIVLDVTEAEAKSAMISLSVQAGTCAAAERAAPADLKRGFGSKATALKRFAEKIDKGLKRALREAKADEPA